MSTESTPAKQKKPLWRRLVKWSFRAVIVVVVVGVVGYAITSYWASRAIRNELARIVAAHEPLTFAELEALIPKVERDQDAGPFYAAACELENVDHETFTTQFPPNQSPNEVHYDEFFWNNPLGGPVLPGPVSLEGLAWAHRGVDQNRIPFDLVDRASDLPGCNSNIQLQYGMAVALPHLGKTRGLMNICSLRTRLLAIEGQGDAAVKSFISSLGLLRILDRQPVLVDALAQLSILARGCGDARIVLERGHPSDAALQKMNEALLRSHIIQPRQMFMAERVYYLETMRNLFAGGHQIDHDAPPLPEREMLSSLRLVGSIMTARGLPSYARCINAATGDWPGILSAVESAADKPATLWDETPLPSIGRVMVYWARQLSIYRSMLIAIEIERFRLAHNGQLPDSLAQLPHDLPKDPFTGNPLLFVKVADGYCVISAGRGRAEDDSWHLDRDKDPMAWAVQWGIHVRTAIAFATTERGR